MIVSFDIETTGIDRDKCQVIEVGAVAYSPEEDRVVGKFSAIVCHDTIVGEPMALAMNAAILEEMEILNEVDHGETKVMSSLQAWLHFHAGSYPYALGFNVGSFDLGFRLAGKRLGDLFHHRTIELGSIMMANMREMYPINSQDTQIALSMEEGITHRALEDAEFALEVYRREVLHK